MDKINFTLYYTWAKYNVHGCTRLNDCYHSIATIWTKLISFFTILGPSITSTCKGLTRVRPLSCGFDSSLLEHCTGIAEVVGSNPAQSLNFPGLCSCSVTAALALMTVIRKAYVLFSSKYKYGVRCRPPFLCHVMVN